MTAGRKTSDLSMGKRNPAMDRSELERLGVAINGGRYGWARNLARVLDKHETTVWRWKSGHSEIEASEREAIRHLAGEVLPQPKSADKPASPGPGDVSSGDMCSPVRPGFTCPPQRYAMALSMLNELWTCRWHKPGIVTDVSVEQAAHGLVIHAELAATRASGAMAAREALHVTLSERDGFIGVERIMDRLPDTQA